MRNPQAFFLRAASLLGAAAVLLGAFAAHGLRDALDAESLVVFETGVRYHLIHALALLALSLAPRALWRSAGAELAAWSWLAGTALFSGSLYVLALSDIRAFGFITPIGGLVFVVGWLSLLRSAGGLKDA